MKISYDPEVDALSITFRETTVTTKHLGEGIAADYDADGKLARHRNSGCYQALRWQGNATPGRH